MAAFRSQSSTAYTAAASSPSVSGKSSSPVRSRSQRLPTAYIQLPPTNPRPGGNFDFVINHRKRVPLVASPLSRIGRQGGDPDLLANVPWPTQSLSCHTSRRFQIRNPVHRNVMPKIFHFGFRPHREHGFSVFRFRNGKVRDLRLALPAVHSASSFSYPQTAAMFAIFQLDPNFALLMIPMTAFHYSSDLSFKWNSGPCLQPNRPPAGSPASPRKTKKPRAGFPNCGNLTQGSFLLR